MKPFRGPSADDGPDAEFTQFVASRWRALAHTAYLLTGDFHEGEDLLQATLAKLYSRWSQVRPDTAEHYVRRALVNTYRSWHRKRRVVHLLLPTIPETSAVESGGGLRAVGEDTLIHALASLPERQRAVVVLRYWDDLPVEEVARILGCSVGTVKSQASHARAKLRHHLTLESQASPKSPGESP